MNILIPMAGAGSRFLKAGYKQSKPAIPTYDRKDGRLKPMVVCATTDLPGIMIDGSNILYVDRDFHRDDGTEKAIHDFFPKSRMITVDRLTDGQASTCLLAEEFVYNAEELLIAGCDNGMDYDQSRFDYLRSVSDVIVFTYKHNEAVLVNPDAYGWMIVDGNDNITDISIKKAISDNPMEDNAVVATFWFKKGSIFVKSAKKMIAENDRVNNEFYVDQVIKHVLELGYKAKAFEVSRYICWGTPEDFEQYQKTFEYWRGFVSAEKEYLR